MDQKKERVAICIPTYNQAQYLDISVKSALSQKGPFEIEVWVSDDASTDNTEEVMKKLCDKDKRIHYYKQPKNIGIAENRSWVLSQPDTEFVVNLDSDDILKEEFLLTLVPKLHQYPDAGYAHAATEFIDSSEKTLKIVHLFRSKEYLFAESSLREIVKGMKTTCNIIIFRKKTLQNVNYTKNRHPHGSDYELLIRIADFGFGNIYVNKVLSKYRLWENKRHNLASKAIGAIKLFEESLIPAFQKRGWDITEIIKIKKKQALQRSVALIDAQITNQEKAEIVNLLFRLGDSRRLRLRLKLYQFGLGKFFKLKKKFEFLIINVIKNLLMRTPV
jgi:glycosyltransferase involved in cell wall biosynthesis